MRNQLPTQMLPGLLEFGVMVVAFPSPKGSMNVSAVETIKGVIAITSQG